MNFSNIFTQITELKRLEYDMQNFQMIIKKKVSAKNNASTHTLAYT